VLSILALVLDLGVDGTNTRLLAGSLSNAKLLLKSAVLATYQNLAI